MPKIKPLYLLPPVIFLGLAALMFIGLKRENPNELPSAMIGRTAPVLSVGPLMDQPLLTADDLNKSEVKIVNFWASWCAPCRVEHVHIQAMADLGLPVYGINYKDRPDQAMQFLRVLSNPYTKIGADNGRTGLDWGLYGVPETFVIGKDGRVLLRHAGPVTQRVMNEDILPLIAKE